MAKPDEELRRLRGGLYGISDTSLEAHIAQWAAQEDALEALRYARERIARPSVRAAAPVDADTRGLMLKRVRDLDLKIEGQLAECVAEVEGELASRGITWRPLWYIGTSGYVDGEFWTANKANSINIPWYLANDLVWRAVNTVKVGYTKEDVMRVLRHEAAHALGYAFRLYEREDWLKTFGNFSQPYKDTYTFDPASTDHVQYLHSTGPSQNSHYAQKHPDEDWAETFAVWLDPNIKWREAYAAWPGALRKLEYVDWLVNVAGAVAGEAPNKDEGQREPYTKTPGTVGDFVGGWSPADLWSPAGEMIRREAQLATHAALHRAYFASLAPGLDGGSAQPVWSDMLRETAAAGMGWAVLCYDTDLLKVRAYALPEGGSPPVGEDVIVVLDLYEHAWWGEYPGRKDLYVAAALKNVDWPRAVRLIARASEY